MGLLQGKGCMHMLWLARFDTSLLCIFFFSDHQLAHVVSLERRSFAALTFPSLASSRCTLSLC